MKKYYINNNAQENGDNEVHVEECVWLSLARNTSYLGMFNNCSEAVKAAKSKYFYPNINGCATCSKFCHTT